MIILQAHSSARAAQSFSRTKPLDFPRKLIFQGRRGQEPGPAPCPRVNPVLEMDAHEGEGRATVAVAELRPIAPTSAIPLKIEVPGMTEGLYLPLPHHNPVSVIDPHVSGLASSPSHRPRARPSLGTCLR